MNAAVRAVAEELSRSDGRVFFGDEVVLRPYIEAFLDPAWLDDQLRHLDRWVERQSAPLAVMQLGDRPLGSNFLVAALWAARHWQAHWRPGAGAFVPTIVKWFTMFAANVAVTELHSQGLLDDEARKHLQDRLQDANQVWSFAHECQTFTVFVRAGTNPVPYFLRHASRTEIHTWWNGQLVPVECKAKRPRAGRYISHELFTRLAVAIARDLEATGRRLVVRIRPADPDKVRPEDIEALRRFVGTTARDHEPSPLMHATDGRVYSITTTRTDDTVSSLADASALLRRLQLYAGFVLARPGRGSGAQQVLAVVGVEGIADDPRKQQNTLRDSINDAATQLAGGPPGLAAVHYFQVNPFFEGREWLPVWAEDLALDTLRRRPQMAGIIITGEPDLSAPDATGRIEAYSTIRWERLPPGYPLGTSLVSPFHDWGCDDEMA
jgi:hypothetical protein